MSKMKTLYPDNFDYFDTMTPVWSNEMGKQYNKDAAEDETINLTKELEKELFKDMGKRIDAINPKHYQDVAFGYQYIDLMGPMLARFSGLESHLMGQTYKYLMRAGNKDPLLQDLKKAKWYLDKFIETLEKE